MQESRISHTTMEQTLFTFDSTHHALWAEEEALERRLPVEVVPAPAAAAARCNLALLTLPELVSTLAGALTEAGVPFRLHPAPREPE